MAGCEVCDEPEFKYRCPSCKARSCSLPCFKSHHADCQIIPSSQAEQGPHVSLESAISRSSKEELQDLFQAHPQLRHKLRAIYEVTLDPASRTHQGAALRQGRYEPRWTEEKGFEHGLRVLKARLESDSTSGEDIQAFVEYVSRNTHEK